ncbi:MAG: UDP-N-acetylmuramoyl-L-alanyl-D-glutamate--2,6-diaminopimelate ligase [Alphaproteobacteria bacterium]|nr:UDP-N-acetylmuramoyl-L-alanyl-D-glutamate--2,6-diaminopimelate ligase [Alphaproteobacteria bacterium]
MPLLSELIATAFPDAGVHGATDIAIAHITTDSRAVRDGSLFVAMPGVMADGARYIPDALRAGAAAILMAQGSRSDVVATVPVIRVADMRAAASALAAAFYPTQPKFCMAITGTDGKTSSADFVRQLARLSGLDAASVGTLGLRSDHPALDMKYPSINTSPEPILLHEMLHSLASEGVQVTAIETSSHGLDQKRADGVRFCAGAFTNLTRDHLDYHGTLEAYFAAKARLFSEVLAAGKLAVLNRDDAHFGALKALCDARGLRVLSFGIAADADYRLVEVKPHAHGLDAVLMLHGKKREISLPLYGAFQLSNMLTAVGLLQAAGLAEAALIGLLPQLRGVPGRLEKIALHRGAPIFIDYAHTPAALENILKTLRPHTQNKLHVLFGCGGDRDAGKRPEMGAAACRFADVVTVTDDNPRSEDAAVIRAAIMAGATGAREVAGRDLAIVRAIENLQAGDVLVVAGKGHETTQTIGNHVIPFSDAEHIRKAVAA